MKTANCMSHFIPKKKNTQINSCFFTCKDLSVHFYSQGKAFFVTFSQASQVPAAASLAAKLGIRRAFAKSADYALPYFITPQNGTPQIGHNLKFLKLPILPTFPWVHDSCPPLSELNMQRLYLHDDGRIPEEIVALSVN